MYHISNWDDFFHVTVTPSTTCGPSDNTAVFPGSNVVQEQPPSLPRRRQSYQAQKDLQLDVDLIRTDLLRWECSSPKCGKCLGALTENEIMMSFAVSTILAYRQVTFDRPQHEIGDHIKQMLTHCLRLGRSTLQYVVAGIRTCKTAWNWAHGFSAATSNRVHAKFHTWWKQATPVTTTLDSDNSSACMGATALAERWLLEWVTLATHNPPNGAKGSVPPMTASILYPQYQGWCQSARCYPIQQDGFRGKMSIIKRQLEVATRASKQGSAECPVCSILKRAEAQTFSLHLKKAIKDLQATHIEFTNGENKVYMDHAFQARDDKRVSPCASFSCTFDIMTLICVIYVRYCPWLWMVRTSQPMTSLKSWVGYPRTSARGHRSCNVALFMGSLCACTIS